MQYFTLLAALVLFPIITGVDQPFVANYDEAKIPSYELPDPLVTESGDPVTDAEAWHRTRRPELLELFRTHVYGRVAASHAKSNTERSAPSLMLSRAKRYDAKSMSYLASTPMHHRCGC